MLNLTILLIEIETYLAALHHYLSMEFLLKGWSSTSRCKFSLTGRKFDVFQDNLDSDFTTRWYLITGHCLNYGSRWHLAGGSKRWSCTTASWGDWWGQGRKLPGEWRSGRSRDEGLASELITCQYFITSNWYFNKNPPQHYMMLTPGRFVDRRRHWK